MLPIRISSTTKHMATFAYRGRKIPFCFWSNGTATHPPDTVLFLGTGQIRKIPQWVAAAAPTGIVVVEGLPHWHSDPSAHDLSAFSHLYTQQAYEAVLQTFNRPHMHIIGQSQAAPGTIWLANHVPKKVGNVALVLPMGLNTSSFGATHAARFKELGSRTLKTLMQIEQSFFHDVRNVYIAGLLLGIIISGLRDGSTVNKYTMGISEDMLEDFRRMVQGQSNRHHSVTLFLGNKDVIFRASEIKQSLEQASILGSQIEIVPNQSHSSLALRSSEALVRQVVEAVRKS